jgi:curved DNA-binding protein CbpA
MPGKKKTHYDVLGLKKKASDADIKNAFRKLAKEYHPDANPGDKEAERRFKEIKEAYETLKDPEKRAAYDKINEKMTRRQALEHAVNIALEIQQDPSNPDPDLMQRLDDVIRDYAFTDAELEAALQVKLDRLKTADNLFGVADFIQRIIKKHTAESDARVAAADQRADAAEEKAQQAAQAREFARKNEAAAKQRALKAEEQLRGAQAMLDAHGGEMRDVQTRLHAALMENARLKGEALPPDRRTSLGRAFAMDARFRDAVERFTSPMAEARACIQEALKTLALLVDTINEALPAGGKIRFVHGLHDHAFIPDEYDPSLYEKLDPHQHARGYIVFTKEGETSVRFPRILVFSVQNSRDDGKVAYAITPGNSTGVYGSLNIPSVTNASMRLIGMTACCSSNMLLRLPQKDKYSEHYCAYVYVHNAERECRKIGNEPVNAFDRRIHVDFGKDFSWVPNILKNHFMSFPGVDCPPVRAAITRLAAEPH